MAKHSVAVAAATALCLCASAYAADHKAGDKLPINFACVNAEDALAVGVATDRVVAAEGGKRESLKTAAERTTRDLVVNGACWLIPMPVLAVIGKVVATDANTEVRTVQLPDYPDKTWYIPMDLTHKEHDL